MAKSTKRIKWVTHPIAVVGRVGGKPAYRIRYSDRRNVWMLLTIMPDGAIAHWHSDHASLKDAKAAACDLGQPEKQGASDE